MKIQCFQHFSLSLFYSGVIVFSGVYMPQSPVFRVSFFLLYSVLFNDVVPEYNILVGVRKPCQESCRVLMPDIFYTGKDICPYESLAGETGKDYP